MGESWTLGGVDTSSPSCALLQTRGRQDCEWPENITSVSACCFPLRQEEKRFSRSQSWGGAGGGQRQGQLSHEKLREVSVSPTLAWRHFLCISQIPLSFLTSAAYRLGVGSRSLCPQGGNRRHYALVQICWGLRGGEGLTLFLVLLDTSTQVTILHRLTGERGAGHTCG